MTNVLYYNDDSDDSKILKRLEKLISSYRQKRFTGKIGKHINQKVLLLLRQGVIYHLH